MRRVIALLTLVLASCVPPAAPDVRTPCAAACARGRDLACAWSASTPAGATCEAVCEHAERAHAEHGYASMAPTCLAAASTCAAAERCAP